MIADETTSATPAEPQGDSSNHTRPLKLSHHVAPGRTADAHLGLPSKFEKRLDVSLFVVVAIFAGGVFYLLLRNLQSQLETYGGAIANAGRQTIITDSVVLAFARSSDFAVIKTSVVFLGFVLALLGALYVLRTATVKYSLELKSKGSAASLGTSSPGLVMVTIGVAAVVCALYSRSYVEIDSSKFPRQPQVSVQFKPVEVTPTTHAKAAKTGTAYTPAIHSAGLTGRTLDELVENIPAFREGSYELTADQRTVLDVIAGRLLANPQAAVDLTVGIQKSMPNEYESKLQEMRAGMLRDYLLNKLVNSDQVRVVGNGKMRPTP